MVFVEGEIHGDYLAQGTTSHHLRRPGWDHSLKLVTKLITQLTAPGNDFLSYLLPSSNGPFVPVGRVHNSHEFWLAIGQLQSYPSLMTSLLTSLSSSDVESSALESVSVEQGFHLWATQMLELPTSRLELS